MLKSKRGFTLIELIIVIVCMGILVIAAFPMFIDISSESEQASEDDLVGGIKTGLELVRAETLINTGAPIFPSTLDDASVGASSVSNPFFENVLQDPYRGDDWQKENATTYTGPASGIYEYDNSAGTFEKQN